MGLIIREVRIRGGGCRFFVRGERREGWWKMEDGRWGESSRVDFGDGICMKGRW